MEIAVPRERIDAVRAFNRFYTAMIGVLTEGLLETPYSLTEARVIFELGHRDACEVVALRRSLDLDAGYLSRILSRFEADGLVVRERAADDARRQIVRLAGRGREVFDDLDGRSAAQVGRILAGLAEDDQRRLVGAMGAIHGILGERAVPAAYVLRPLGPGDLGWVVQRHGALCCAEYGWDESFEAMVARIVADYAEAHDPRRERGWIAEVDGEPVGSIFCVRADDETAKLRLLLVEPKARGMGVGGRLVEECVRFAERAGYRRMVLFTHDVLADARRLYQRAGFVLDNEERKPAYGQDLVHQHWRLNFSRPSR